MKTVSTSEIKNPLNNCFEKYDPDWESNINSSNHKIGFKYYLEKNAGIRISFNLDSTRNSIYRIETIEIVDEALFSFWLLKWS